MQGQSVIKRNVWKLVVSQHGAGKPTDLVGFPASDAGKPHFGDEVSIWLHPKSKSRPPTDWLQDLEVGFVFGHAASGEENSFPGNDEQQTSLIRLYYGRQSHPNPRVRWARRPTARTKNAHFTLTRLLG